MANTDQKVYSAVPTATKGIMVVALGAVLGLALVYLAYLPIQILIAIGAGLLLLIFPISPANFLLAYLIGLSFLDLLIPFFTGQLLGLQFGPQILFRGGLIVLLVYYWLINQRNPLAFKPALPMFILLAMLALSTLSSGVNVQGGLISLAKIGYWMFLLLTVADMVAHGKMKLNTIYRCVMISTLGFMLVVLASPILGIDLGSFYGTGDVRGPYSPHSLALCLCMGLIVVLTLCVQQQNRFFLMLLLLSGVAMAISIARTYARIGYTSLIASLSIFVLMFWSYRKRQASLRRHKLILGLALIIIVGVLGLYSLAYSEEFAERISDLSDTQTAGSGRIRIYEAALKRYADFSVFKQVFGGGIGATLGLLEEFVPHNDYLYILLSGGLLGIALYLWLFILLWKQLKSTARGAYLPLIIAGSVIGIYLVATMTNGVIEYMSVMTFFSFLVGGAMGHYARAGRMHTVCYEKQNLDSATPGWADR